MTEDQLYNIFVLLLATFLIGFGAWDVRRNFRRELRNGLSMILGFTMYALLGGWFLGCVKVPPPTTTYGLTQFGIAAVIGYILTYSLVWLLTRRQHLK